MRLIASDHRNRGKERCTAKILIDFITFPFHPSTQPHYKTCSSSDRIKNYEKLPPLPFLPSFPFPIRKPFCNTTFSKPFTFVHQTIKSSLS